MPSPAICVDDGSTDSSGSICDEYAKNDARIKVIHKQNAGYGSAINTGIDAATGKYLAILESDDFADKKIYENLFNIAENYQADVIKCDWFAYWGETKFVEKVGSIPKYMVNKPITIADFVDLLKNKTNLCHLSLKTIPTGVSHVRISPQDVEYIIEEVTEDESDSDL